MLTCLFIMGQVFSSSVSPFSKLNMSRPIVEKCMQFLHIFIYSMPIHNMIYKFDILFVIDNEI